MTDITRRAFVAQAGLAAAALARADGSAPAEVPPHQATGTRVGEVTDSSAVVWTRLTAAPTRNNGGVKVSPRRKMDDPDVVNVPVDQLEGACPGAAGRIRLRYGAAADPSGADLSGAAETAWAEVGAEGDFIHQFRLQGLKPGTTYHYAAETTGPGGEPRHGAFRGKFRTAPAPDAAAPVRFCVMTCQGYPDRGHPDGHPIYPSMQSLDPDFAALTGDLVYYDNDPPRAVNARLARFHWERMFSLPRLREFTRSAATYWLKDDHDTLNNDSWPGTKMGELTFAEGQKIFRQQAPLTDGPSYRTFRWGRDLQIWLTDGRDFRSPNKMPDGPDKSIWGAGQKAWFRRTVKESDATWKVVISPTPLVGPDRARKNDNHANEGFRTEGDEIREWIRSEVGGNLIAICGDRHWQYHSQHPKTGLNEFSVGAASDQHAGGSPGENKAYHRFHRVKGGFLSVSVRREDGRSVILFELRDVEGKVVYSWAQSREPGA